MESPASPSASCGPGRLSSGAVRAAISRGLDRYRLRIFLDKRVVEVYVNDGEAAVYTTVDAPAAGHRDHGRLSAIRREGPCWRRTSRQRSDRPRRESKA